DNIQIFVVQAAWQNGAPVHINGWYIGAQHAHHATRHVLVAPADYDHAIHPLALHASFHTICNDFARNQGILHALSTHGHAIGNSRSTKNLSIAACAFYGLDGSVSQLLQTTITGGDRAMA